LCCFAVHGGCDLSDGSSEVIEIDVDWDREMNWGRAGEVWFWERWWLFVVMGVM
jgi:hypothetical protein